MEYARARGKLPPELDGLLASQMTAAINEANLGLSDRAIAQRYLVDRLPQIDIAVEIGLDRSTVTKRLRDIKPRVAGAASKLNIHQ